MHSIKPKTALISLSDKSGLEELVKFLVSKEVKMLSTGGTYKAIKEITSEVVEVSDFTGFEEMMDGRVKTLHPVKSETSTTSDVISFIALKVPPVESIFTSFETRNLTSSSRPDLSERLIRAVFGFIECII